MNEPALSPAHPPALTPPLRLLIAVLLLGGLPQLLLDPAQRLVAWLAPGAGDNAAATASLGAAALVFVAFALAQPPPVRWRPLRARGVLMAYLPFALGWVALVVAYLQAMHGLGHRVPPQPLLEQVARQGLGAGTWPILLGAVALAPVVEELLFRGYLLGVLLPLVPGGVAQLLTAAAFGLMHGLDYALPLGVLGLLFGWLRTRHGALLPSMLAHAVHNALVFSVTAVWPASLELIYPR